MNTQTIPVEIYHGIRGKKFRDMIIHTLVSVNIKQKYIDILTDNDSMKIWGRAFTSKDADIDSNYELLELLGDVAAGHAIKKYMYRRFPQLHCHLGVKVIARLLINYGSRYSFSKLATELGFLDYITSSVQERTDTEKRHALLEDVFEAFCGALEEIADTRIIQGIGYTLVYDFIKMIFDKRKVSLEFIDLFDPVTLLKELMDKPANKEALGGINYKFTTSEVDGRISYRVRVFSTRHGLLGESDDFVRKLAQQSAAKKALDTLKKMGYERVPPPEYKMFCLQK